MTISVGKGPHSRGQGFKKGECLRLTLSRADLLTAQERWGNGEVRLRFAAKRGPDHSWDIYFCQSQVGNAGRVKMPGGDNIYLTFTWALPPALKRLPGMSRSHPTEPEEVEWLPNGELRVRVREARRRASLVASPTPSPTIKESSMFEAAFELERTTPGTYRYDRVSGHKAIASTTLYLKRDEIEGQPPKRLVMIVAPAQENT